MGQGPLEQDPYGSDLKSASAVRGGQVKRRSVGGDFQTPVKYFPSPPRRLLARARPIGGQWRRRRSQPESPSSSLPERATGHLGGPHRDRTDPDVSDGPE